MMMLSNNLEEVTQEYERIKLSYEILSDRKRRLRYDRNIAIADPAAAMSRAAMNFVGWGLIGVGKGVLKLGELAINQVTSNEDPKDEESKNRQNDSTNGAQ